jgi:hypothetical protein
MADEERMKILKMLEKGKIKAEEAARLLEAVGEGGAEPAAGPAAKGRGKTLHIRVFRGGSERPNVNVNVPLSLAKWALKFVPEHAKARVGEKEVDLDELGTLLDEGVGELVTVEDEDKNERVVISIK